VNGNGISARTHLQEEEVQGSFENFVGTMVDQRKGRVIGGESGRGLKERRGEKEECQVILWGKKEKG
jgi:hypothetical protein